MKRRRKIRMDLLSGDTAAVFLLGVLFLLGGAAGCLAAGSVKGDSGLALQEYLTAYFTLAEESGIGVSFSGALWEQVRFPLLVLLFGFTAAGIVGIPVLFALRGFLFTFSVACFCRLFGWGGIVPAIFLFGLPALLWAPVLFVLGSQGLGASYQMLCRLRGRGGGLAFCEGKYWLRCAVCAFVLALCVAFECLVLPVLVGASAHFVL